jgi:hypothetical protein
MARAGLMAFLVRVDIGIINGAFASYWVPGF